MVLFIQIIILPFVDNAEFFKKKLLAEGAVKKKNKSRASGSKVCTLVWQASSRMPRG
jgi:hypothetical protein